MLPLSWIYWLNLTILPYKLTSWSANCSQWKNFGIVSTVDGYLVNIILCHTFNMNFRLQIKFPDLWGQQNIALAKNLILCFLDERNVVSLKTGVIQCQCSLWQRILWNTIPEIFRSCHLPVFCYCNPSFLPFPFLSTNIFEHQLCALGPRVMAGSKQDPGLLLLFSKVKQRR